MKNDKVIYNINKDRTNNQTKLNIKCPLQKDMLDLRGRKWAWPNSKISIIYAQ